MNKRSDNKKNDHNKEIAITKTIGVTLTHSFFTHNIMTDKGWVVVIKRSEDDILTSVWGSYLTEEEAETKRKEIIETDGNFVATILPLTPPASQTQGKKRVIPHQQKQEIEKQSKVEEFTYYCVVTENFDQRTLEIILCLDESNATSVHEMEWFILHANSDCPYTPPATPTSDEESEEDEHNFADCVHEANHGLVTTLKVISKLNFKRKGNEYAYAVIERNNKYDVHIKVSSFFLYIVTSSSSQSLWFDRVSAKLAKSEKIEKVHSKLGTNCCDILHCCKSDHILSETESEFMIKKLRIEADR